MLKSWKEGLKLESLANSVLPSQGDHPHSSNHRGFLKFAFVEKKLVTLRSSGGCQGLWRTSINCTGARSWRRNKWNKRRKLLVSGRKAAESRHLQFPSRNVLKVSGSFIDKCLNLQESIWISPCFICFSSWLGFDRISWATHGLLLELRLRETERVLGIHIHTLE